MRHSGGQPVYKVFPGTVREALRGFGKCRLKFKKKETKSAELKTIKKRQEKTLLNIFYMILIATIIGYSSFNFKHKIKGERISLLESSQLENREVVTEKALLDLPPVVQSWLTNSGIIGEKLISNVHLVQELQIKMKPEQANWNDGTAEQYFTIQPPAFNWNINTEMNTILHVVGRDKFEDGEGEMTIKLLSLIPVANAKNSEKVNQATLQRYLAEIVWFPSASLSQYIK